MKAEEIPIYIVNRNRLTTTKELVYWLLDSGMFNITIVDNGSTYQPLLDWYDLGDVRVVFMNRNAGPWVIWTMKMHEIVQPYIVTDSDIVPSVDCPKDLVARLQEVLYQNWYGKVGPSIRLDNLPESPWREQCIASQKKYWERTENGSYIAPIDTTFAIYKSEWIDPQPGTALRLAPPYSVEHRPWYTWPLTEEEKFYRANADTTTSMIDKEPYFRFA